MREFCSNVQSFVETIVFKVELRGGVGHEQEVEKLVTSMLSEGKVTSLKVIYIHLRDNRLFPKGKSSF